MFDIEIIIFIKSLFRAREIIINNIDPNIILNV